MVKYNLLSKDFFLIINNLLLIVSALTIFIGTIYPMILEIFSGDRISVGPPFYTITVIPIIFLFTILASMAIFLPWGKLKTNFGTPFDPSKQKKYIEKITLKSL